jgi:hypothetical protein
MGKKRKMYRMFVGKRKWRRPLGIRRLRYKDKNKTDMKETRIEIGDEFLWLRIGNSRGLW